METHEILQRLKGVEILIEEDRQKRHELNKAVDSVINKERVERMEMQDALTNSLKSLSEAMSRVLFSLEGSVGSRGGIADDLSRAESRIEMIEKEINQRLNQLEKFQSRMMAYGTVILIAVTVLGQQNFFIPAFEK